MRLLQYSVLGLPEQISAILWILFSHLRQRSPEVLPSWPAMMAVRAGLHYRNSTTSRHHPQFLMRMESGQATKPAFRTGPIGRCRGRHLRTRCLHRCRSASEDPRPQAGHISQSARHFRHERHTTFTSVMQSWVLQRYITRITAISLRCGQAPLRFSQNLFRQSCECSFRPSMDVLIKLQHRLGLPVAWRISRSCGQLARRMP